MIPLLTPTKGAGMLAAPARGSGATILELEPPFHARVRCRPLPETPLLAPAKGVGTLAAPAPGSGAMMLELEPPFMSEYAVALYLNPPPPPSTRLHFCPLPYPKPPPPI